MSLHDTLASINPRSNVRTKLLFLLALASSTFCIWSVYSWYSRIHTGFDNIPTTGQSSLENEKETQLEEILKLKGNHEQQLKDAQDEISRLNSSTSTAPSLGYDNYPGGQIPPVGGLSMEDVVVVIKTGATESHKLMPIHLTSTLLHTPNYLLFSDAEEWIGGYHLQDALNESFNPEIVRDTGEYELYTNQKKYMALDQSPQKLELPKGWELDKYKNVPMLSKSYHQRPDAKWYLFIDADTYVLMGNMLQYFSGIDYNKKHYIGGISFINGIAFGHGGTGYAVSRGAMKHVMTTSPNVAKEYDQVARDTCCGDYVLARCMKDHGIDLTAVDPNFQGRPQYKVELEKKSYCEPIITMHHLKVPDLSTMWNLEKKIAKPGQYILHADIFEHFVYPHLQKERFAWDCMSSDKGEVKELPKDTWKGKEIEVFDKDEDKMVKTVKPLSPQERRMATFNACKKICEEKADCVMFRSWKEECKVDWHLALGYKMPVTDPDEEEYNSGWMMDRVEEMRSARPCPQPAKDWPQNHIHGI